MLVTNEDIAMKKHKDLYSRREELLNTLTHAIGAGFSIIALILMILRAADTGYMVNVIAVTIFGLTLISMYAASSLYHGITHPKWKKVLRKVDHLNIYLLIAGTYTPIALIALSGVNSWLILAILWGSVIAGFIYKILFFGDGWLSTALYVIMGWTALGFIVQIVEALPGGCLMWIVLGGALYTSGVVFYMLDEKIEFCHFLWHLFVFAGSLAHFFAIYLYVARMD
ncbi:PAQR family membrane homeostasis protein TrhA [Fastidiosibacter lacustris]|uniref:PAQR family membrane homeostasis protein TrhA n=1 Tax=Fastidiosibacter lacustris TaxID=2056695 RepID=UPI000E3506E1|nr:hemolysin III family protein [Fastidiosibacter lacustris]